jgi:transcriptional regulator with XRE-family HTH domain
VATDEQKQAMRLLGQRLRSVRAQHGVHSQRSASAAIGKHPQWMWRAEQGLANITYLMLCDVARLYEMDLSALLEGTGYPPPAND